MTLEETGIVMDILTTAYPHFYSGPNAPDMVKAIRLWREMFARDDVAAQGALQHVGYHGRPDRRAAYRQSPEKHGPSIRNYVNN